MEEKLIEILGENAQSVKEKVLSRISNEVKDAAKHLEKSLSHYGRCNVCTLKLPCNHPQKNHSEVPEIKTHGKVNYWRIKSRENPMRGTDLDTLEKIDNYREKKINLEIEELKKSQENEHKKILEKKIAEEKRMKHVSEQKNKLEKYKEDIRERKEIMIGQIKENMKRQRMEEVKFKQNLEIQKRKLAGRYEKNKCIDNFYKVKE